jgi:hypothetical protein
VTTGGMVAAMTTTSQPIDLHRVWLYALVQELRLAERAISGLVPLMTKRLGDVPPALSLDAVGNHATMALAELVPLIKRYERWVDDDGGAALAPVSMFATIHDYFVAEAPTTSERAYRSLLVRLRQGLDLVEVTAAVADPHDPELARWCEQWLAGRRPLVMAVADELGWFVSHPEQANMTIRHEAAASVGLHAFMRGCRRAVDRLRRAVAGNAPAVAR